MKTLHQSANNAAWLESKQPICFYPKATRLTEDSQLIHMMMLITNSIAKNRYDYQCNGHGFRIS